MRLVVCIPNHGFGDMAAGPLLYAQQRCPYIEGDIELLKFTGSSLTQNHNLGLCQAINGYRQGLFNHLLLMHSDVQPQGEDWLTLLIEQFERAGADVMSCAIPMKNNLGLTSTALDTDPWRPQRLTLQQIKRLPVTWTSPQLLVNTGLLLLNLAKIEALNPPLCFNFQNRIERLPNGDWTQNFIGEDWVMSRQLHAGGLRLYVTRVLKVYHTGHQIYPSAPAWGMSLDADCVLPSEKISITDAWGEMSEFDSLDDGEIDHEDTLPSGWFSPTDIQMYRRMYELVPDGGSTAEIGCYRGRSIASVADIIREKGLHVSCVDTFKLPMPIDHSDRLPAFLQMIQDRGLSDHIQIFNGESVASSKAIPDASLDLIFIDADHTYKSVRADLRAWLPKLKLNGWIGGHDYGQPGVRQAVNEQFRLPPRVLNTSIWLTQGTGILSP